MLSTNLPKGEDLSFSDGKPVDNELHILVPNLLGFILGFVWSERLNWFFGINMGIYYSTGVNPRVPIVPDAFLSLGVERIKNNQLRNSYVVWEEDNVVPIFALEVVSKTPGDEYDDKMIRYAQLGVLYYIIYNPDYWRRDGHEPFEVYRLVAREYQRQFGEPFWMGEVGLGIGRGIGTHRGIEREWLYWYDKCGNRIESPDARLATQQLENARLQQLLQRYQERFGRLEEE